MFDSLEDSDRGCVDGLSQQLRGPEPQSLKVSGDFASGTQTAQLGEGEYFQLHTSEQDVVFKDSVLCEFTCRAKDRLFQLQLTILDT